MKYFNLISVYVEQEKIKINIDNICFPENNPTPKEASFISEEVEFNYRHGLGTVNNTYENIYPVFKELAKPIQEKPIIFKKINSKEDMFPIQAKDNEVQSSSHSHSHSPSLEEITAGATSREEMLAMMNAAFKKKEVHNAARDKTSDTHKNHEISQFQLTSYTYELPTKLEQALAMMAVFDDFINVKHGNFVNTCTLDEFRPKNEHNFYVKTPIKNELETNIYEKILQLIQEEKEENQLKSNRDDHLITHEQLYAHYYTFLRGIVSINNPPKTYQMILDIAKNIYDFCAILSDREVSPILAFSRCLTDERLIKFLRTNDIAQKNEYHASIPDEDKMKPLIGGILNICKKYEIAKAPNSTVIQQGIFSSTREKPRTINASEYSYSDNEPQQKKDEDTNSYYCTIQ